MARLIGLVVLAVVVFFAWIFFGNPIHDSRLWILDRQFTHTDFHHPTESVLLGRKSYLGGPRGGGICIYATGEVRRTTLGQKDTLSSYQDAMVGKLPIKIYFTDESDLPYYIPFGDWQSELGITPYTEKDVYIVYVEKERPFLYDLRCND